MSDLKFDLGFSSRTVAAYPLSRRVAIVKSAEASGFDRLWHSNEKFGRDMVANMTLSAVHTRRIGIGAAVTDPYSVHPRAHRCGHGHGGRHRLGSGHRGRGRRRFRLSRHGHPTGAPGGRHAGRHRHHARHVVRQARSGGGEGHRGAGRHAGVLGPARHPRGDRNPGSRGAPPGGKHRRRGHDRHHGDAPGRRHGLGFHQAGRAAGRPRPPRTSRSSRAWTPASTRTATRPGPASSR